MCTLKLTLLLFNLLAMTLLMKV